MLRKFSLLFALYFVQGLPLGFQTVALPVYLRQSGASLTEISFLGLLSLPWMLKALWAPLVDRYSLPRLGRRRSWILPAQAGLALCCALAAVSPGNLYLLLGLLFSMNLLAATQDIAVDGLAVDLLEPGELGWGNAIQVIGYKFGMLTGGGLLVWLSAQIGWEGIFACMAGLVSLAFLQILAFSEPPTAAPARGSFGEILRALGRALWIPGGGWALLFIGTYKFGESMADTLFKPFLVDAGFSVPQIGLWVGTYGMVASLLGSLAGGALAARVSLTGAVALTAGLRALPLLGQWVIVTFGGSAEGVIAITCAEHFFGGALTTAMFAWMMSRVDRRIGASHYTLLASLEVLGKYPGGLLAGVLGDGVGYPPVFALSVVFSLLFLLILIPLARSPSEPDRPLPRL